ncbi:efflux RND transporter periplasmic adaptor subunit [Pedobacter psychrodurus]|uniref:Efflux RND transporter periplasmic adaptor subunit n=1 Tax=Pedobacter psychrodurus TaxID=2530456 RepID=A0A4R0PWL8_9SPHI|nr:efflux RND transporter periplasmic adaptor subunit [Pedobacter psychrodurus]TCD26514.1 efflux RND transporter periplasmic adaptor subunit [Pedobacter psychrodurus]
MKKKLTITLICIALIFFFMFKLASNKKKIEEKNTPVKIKNVSIPVTISPVIAKVEANGLVKTGVLAPISQAKVLSGASGNIKRLLFKIGDQVTTGQSFAVIDTRLLEIDLQKSLSNVSKLKRDLEIYTELLEGNAATLEKVNEIRLNYNDALSQAGQLRRQISDATIKAPTSGVVASKIMEEGMFVTAGNEIASLVNLEKLKVEVFLTESEVYQISLGQEIKLKTDVYPEKPFLGMVTFIAPQANQSYNYQVEITTGNDKKSPLRSGTFVSADFSSKIAKQILLIPREALIESTQDASVYVTQNGRAVLRKIDVGQEYGNLIEVIKGLGLGEQVVTSGQINLKDGTLINITK